MTAIGRVLRKMIPADVPAVMMVQEPASIAGLSRVFSQDRFPFPADVVAGFAAVRGDEVMHFGVAVSEWGSGLATLAHDELVTRMAGAGVRRFWLRVYAANPPGRAFWSKLGWTDTGGRTTGPMPPHTELLTYEKALDVGVPAATSSSTSAVERTSP